jgi:hypothetical protein
MFYVNNHYEFDFRVSAGMPSTLFCPSSTAQLLLWDTDHGRPVHASIKI